MCLSRPVATVALLVTAVFAILPASEVDNITLPADQPCTPGFGLAQHGPMPILNKTGWWYFVCNAQAEGFGEVDIFQVVFETWVVLPDGSGFEQNIATNSISMPAAAAGKRFYNYHETADSDSHNWRRLPVNASTGSISVKGAPNAWKLSADVKSVQGPKYAVKLSLVQNSETVHMGHNKDTGCFTYLAGVEGAEDIFYWSTLGMQIESGPSSVIRLPGEKHWRRLSGTCHYDRQHKSGSTASGSFWRWGESTFYKNLPAGCEELEGRHATWWGLYFDVGGQTLALSTHIGIKGVSDALQEYDGIGISVVSTTYLPMYNTNVTDTLLLTLPSGLAVRAKATVVEAVNNYTNTEGIHNINMRYLESPCEYSVLVGNTWVKVGYGFIELLLTPSNYL